MISKTAFCLIFFAGTALSAPSKPLTDLAASHTIHDRQALDIASEVVSIANDIIDAAETIWSTIQDIDDKQHQAESDFTKGMVAQLRRNHPDKNVLVYHDQDSDVSGLVNAEHSHYELDLPDSPGTQGYEVQVFDSGSFQRAGDGGYINWAYAGDFTSSDDGSEVTFTQIPPVEDPPAAPTVAPAPPPQPTRAYPSNTDGNYFVNCQNQVDGTVSSGMAYYASLNPGQNAGQQPTDYKDVLHGAYYTWEQPGQVQFDTGVTVHWSIFGDAQQGAQGEASGTADNGYENFWVYKDAGEFLYQVDNWICNSIYWAY